MGLAIIGFSFFLRFILNPLTKPYMESMKKIKGIEPLVAKLKKKYQGDQPNFVKAQAELYKQKGINPGAGCLPYILQIVVLIALFNVFSRVLASGPDSLLKLNDLLYSPLRFQDSQSINLNFLHLNLSKPNVFRIPGLPFPLPGILLLLSALAQFASAKMMAPAVAVEKKLAEKTEDKKDDIQSAMQSSTAITFPLLTLFFGMSFPSGLALYWLIFSLFQVWQQYKTSGWGGLSPLLKKLWPR